MELWKEILAQYLAKEQIQIVFPNLKPDPATIVEGECYRALVKIKRILEDDSLLDTECFLKYRGNRICFGISWKYSRQPA